MELFICGEMSLHCKPWKMESEQPRPYLVDNFIVQIKSNKIHNFWKGITFNLPGLRVSAGRNKIVVRWREKMNTRIKCRVGFLRQCNPALGSLPQTKPYFTHTSLLNAESLVMKIWLKIHFGEGGHTHYFWLDSLSACVLSSNATQVPRWSASCLYALPHSLPLSLSFERGLRQQSTVKPSSEPILFGRQVGLAARKQPK